MRNEKNFRVVRAAKGRMREVAMVFRQSFRKTYPNFAVLHSETEDCEYFATKVYGEYEVFVAEAKDSGAILGFIAFDKKTIAHLYVRPAGQSAGIGSELIKIAMQNSTCLRLWTFQQNSVARSFYRKHGFVEIKMTDGQTTEEKQPDVLLEWTSPKRWLPIKKMRLLKI